MASLACLIPAGSSPLTTMDRPPPPSKLCPAPTAMSKPSVAAGLRVVSRSSLVLASRSVSGCSRTVSWALLPERPWNAAWRVWAPVSAAPGMLVWTSSTSSSARSRSSTCWVRARTASDDAPAGGDTVTARMASLPVSMNWVGICDTRDREKTNNRNAIPIVDQRVTRDRSASLSTGVYIRCQTVSGSSPFSSTLMSTLATRK